MRKEQLKQYLSDQPLMQVIYQKMQTNNNRKKLSDALIIATETGLKIAAEKKYIPKRVKKFDFLSALKTVEQ